MFSDINSTLKKKYFPLFTKEETETLKGRMFGLSYIACLNSDLHRSSKAHLFSSHPGGSRDGQHDKKQTPKAGLLNRGLVTRIHNCCRGHFGWLESCAPEKKQGIQYSLQLTISFSASQLVFLGSRAQMLT